MSRPPKRYSSQRKAYSILRKMRWLTFVLGPIPIVWDGVMMPLLMLLGMPAFFTIEDIVQLLFLDLLPLQQFTEEFNLIWPHLNRVCTILFLVFFLWTMSAKDKVQEAKEDATEARIEAEVERRLKQRLAELNNPQPVQTNHIAEESEVLSTYHDFS